MQAIDETQSAQAYSNVAVSTLIEIAIREGEGQLAHNGALVVYTGERTSPHPMDRFIVDEPTGAQSTSHSIRTDLMRSGFASKSICPRLIATSLNCTSALIRNTTCR